MAVDRLDISGKFHFSRGELNVAFFLMSEVQFNIECRLERKTLSVGRPQQLCGDFLVFKVPTFLVWENLALLLLELGNYFW